MRNNEKRHSNLPPPNSINKNHTDLGSIDNLNASAVHPKSSPPLFPNPQSLQTFNNNNLHKLGHFSDTELSQLHLKFHNGYFHWPQLVGEIIAPTPRAAEASNVNNSLSHHAMGYDHISNPSSSPPPHIPPTFLPHNRLLTHFPSSDLYPPAPPSLPPNHHLLLLPNEDYPQMIISPTNVIYHKPASILPLSPQHDRSSLLVVPHTEQQPHLPSDHSVDNQQQHITSGSSSDSRDHSNEHNRKPAPSNKNSRRKRDGILDDHDNMGLDNSGIMLKNRNLVLDKCDILLENRELTVFDSSDIVLDSRNMMLDNGDIVLDNYDRDNHGMVLDNNDMVSDGRNIVLNGRNVMLDNREIVLDGRNIMIYNSDNLVLDNHDSILNNNNPNIDFNHYCHILDSKNTSTHNSSFPFENDHVLLERSSSSPPPTREATMASSPHSLSLPKIFANNKSTSSTPLNPPSPNLGNFLPSYLIEAASPHNTIYSIVPHRNTHPSIPCFYSYNSNNNNSTTAPPQTATKNSPPCNLIQPKLPPIHTNICNNTTPSSLLSASISPHMTPTPLSDPIAGSDHIILQVEQSDTLSSSLHKRVNKPYVPSQFYYPNLELFDLSSYQNTHTQLPEKYDSTQIYDQCL